MAADSKQRRTKLIFSRGYVYVGRRKKIVKAGGRRWKLDERNFVLELHDSVGYKNVNYVMEKKKKFTPAKC